MTVPGVMTLVPSGRSLMFGVALTLTSVSAAAASCVVALTVTAKVQAPRARARLTPSIVRDTVPEFDTPRTKASGGMYDTR